MEILRAWHGVSCRWAGMTDLIHFPRLRGPLPVGDGAETLWNSCGHRLGVQLLTTWDPPPALLGKSSRRKDVKGIWLSLVPASGSTMLYISWVRFLVVVLQSVAMMHLVTP